MLVNKVKREVGGGQRKEEKRRKKKLELCYS
jgi:hypothetical protein